MTQHPGAGCPRCRTPAGLADRLGRARHGHLPGPARLPADRDFLHRCGGPSAGCTWLRPMPSRCRLRIARSARQGQPPDAPGRPRPHAPRRLADLLAFAGRAAQPCRRFAQIMFEPDTAEQVRPALLAAGFSHLAELLYMHRSAYDPVPIQPIDQTTWLTLADTGEAAFADLIRRTYIDSLDCPGLTGMRTMQDVLDSHRGAGEFDPRGWYLLQHRGQPAGVLITVRTPLRTSLEVVYVGLVPAARGKGLGRLCMHRAIQRARDLALARSPSPSMPPTSPPAASMTPWAFPRTPPKDRLDPGLPPRRRRRPLHAPGEVTALGALPYLLSCRCRRRCCSTLSASVAVAVVVALSTQDPGLLLPLHIASRCCRVHLVIGSYCWSLPLLHLVRYSASPATRRVDILWIGVQNSCSRKFFPPQLTLLTGLPHC